MINGNENYEYDTEEGWTDPNTVKTEAEPKSKSNGQSSPPPTAPPANDAEWPIPDKAMFHGLAGEVVAVIIPHTEADKIALLLQFLAYFGNVIGRGPHYVADGAKHYTILFIALVGKSAKARKGTSAERINSIFELVDPDWVRDHKAHGTCSGEGLIWHTRDKIEKMEKGLMTVKDHGVTDKRFFLDEREFSQTLTTIKREGSTAGDVACDMWDCRPNLRTLGKVAPVTATEPHVSVCGHITFDALKRKLDEALMTNGFANRFLFACVCRSKVLPHGGDLDQKALAKLAGATCKAVELARTVDRMTMTPKAQQMWAKIYVELSAEQPGLLGSITARAEAQTVRLAMIYALLDRSAQIDVAHLTAALALWRYCEAGALVPIGLPGTWWRAVACRVSQS